MSRNLFVCVLGTSLLFFGCGGGEHPGEAVEGKAGEEHPGEGQQEHPGEEQQTEGSHSRSFSAGEIKTAMNAHIQQQTAAGQGVFDIHDAQTGKNLKLRFVQIHDPVRKIEGRGYFACTDFKSTTDGTIYDLDFWLQAQGEQLVVTETQIHKVAGNPRYTFRDDEIVVIQ